MTGDPLDYGPAYPVFAERLGKSYTANSSNATITNTVLDIRELGGKLVCHGSFRFFSNKWQITDGGERLLDDYELIVIVLGVNAIDKRHHGAAAGS